MALTGSVSRELYAPGPPMYVYKAAASLAFYQGSIVAIDTADGLLKKGTVSTTLKVVGVSAREFDTTGVAEDDRVIPVDHGTFGHFETEGGADEITADDITKDCYLVDDDTVALTNGGGTRSRAGMIFDVVDGKIVVQFEVIR